MRVHVHYRLDYDDQNVYVGFTQLIIYDMNDALAEVLTHAESFTLLGEVGAIMRAGAGLRPDRNGENQEVGFRLQEEYFPDVLEIIRQGNYQRVMRL